LFTSGTRRLFAGRSQKAEPDGQGMPEGGAGSQRQRAVLMTDVEAGRADVHQIRIDLARQVV